MTEDRINFDRAKFNAIIAKHGYKQQQIDRIRGKQKWVSNKLKEDRGFFKEDLDWLQDLNNAMYQELMNTAIKTMTRERERKNNLPTSPKKIWKMYFQTSWWRSGICMMN